MTEPSAGSPSPGAVPPTFLGAAHCMGPGENVERIRREDGPDYGCPGDTMTDSALRFSARPLLWGEVEWNECRPRTELANRQRAVSGHPREERGRRAPGQNGQVLPGAGAPAPLAGLPRHGGDYLAKGPNTSPRGRLHRQGRRLPRQGGVVPLAAWRCSPLRGTSADGDGGCDEGLQRQGARAPLAT
jgi:hypothetical protein